MNCCAFVPFSSLFLLNIFETKMRHGRIIGLVLSFNSHSEQVFKMAK